MSALPQVWHEASLDTIIRNLFALDWRKSPKVYTEVPLAELEILRGERTVVALHHPTKRFWRRFWKDTTAV